MEILDAAVHEKGRPVYQGEQRTIPRGYQKNHRMVFHLPVHNRVHTFYNEQQNKDVYMIALCDESETLIGYYEKHEFRTKDSSPFYEMN